MRCIFNFCRRINSFEKVTIRTSGMRRMRDHEITAEGSNAVITEYEIGYTDGEEVRTPVKRAACPLRQALRLMNSCRVLSWDGFNGRRPKGLRDGTDFNFSATVNGGRRIAAKGSQRFPRGYRKFTEALRKMLSAG